MSFNRTWLVDVVERLPQAVLSRGWGWLARRRRPRVAVSLLKHAFVRATAVDLSEAALPIGAYPSLEDLFVRPLRSGARRIDPAPDAVVCPVDGMAGMCGVVDNDTLFQVKGRSYRLSDLLGDRAMATRFEGGSYATLYLAPHNYHRIHAPLAGEISEARHIPGALLPVFPEALERVDGLFARNERLITYVDTRDGGRMAVVKVGATMVGRITVAYDPSVQTNAAGQGERSLSYDPPKLVNKGAELGAFQLGSTVVLVVEPGRVSLDLDPGQPVRMGQRIGTVANVRRRRSRRAGRTDADERSGSTVRE